MYVAVQLITIANIHAISIDWKSISSPF
jgi:hypothetical protein